MNVNQKLKTHYAVKTTPLEIKDIDTRSRKVSGYFAAFDSIDSDNDVIRKGAFLKSLQENGVDSSSNRRIAHLRNHDWEQQIGKLEELREDEYGLFFVSSMGRSTHGNDAFLDYQDGILREHSIGFNYIQDKISEVSDSRVDGGFFYEVREVKLWEGSAVTFGANSLTPVIDVAKGENEYNATIKKLAEITEGIYNALKNGKGTDARLENLEFKIKQVQQLTESLKSLEPSIKDTLTKKPNKEENLFDYMLK